MTLHLIRLDPDAECAAHWWRNEGLMSGEAVDEGYCWHALLAAVFGTDLAPKPFRVMARRGRPPQVLAYTPADPAEIEDRARSFADPLALAAIGLGAGGMLAARPMPRFSAGRRLGFSVRVRPSLRTDRDGDRTRSVEIDAYVAALRRAESEGRERPERKAVYSAWCRDRLEAGGVGVVALGFDGLEQAAVSRRDASRRLRATNGHTATLSGVLTVAEPDVFAALLARGIGRHRAFGFGMLLLSPA